MKKIFIILLFILTTSHALVIETNANQWKLVGTDGDISNLNTINFNQGDLIWQYSQSDTQNPWKCYRHGASYITEGTCETISTIGAGSGFWIYSFYDNNITINTQANTYEKTISDSNWTLFTPILKDYNVSDIFNDTNISVIWGYDTNWSFTDDQNSSSSYSQLSVLEKYKGYWFYNPTNVNQYINSKNISFGNDTSSLNNGSFETISKSSSDDVEDIWNLSVPVIVEASQNFNLGVRVEKFNGAFGDIVFHDLSIVNDSLQFGSTQATAYGKRSDGVQAGSYIENSVKENSILYNNGILTIKFGYIMKNQDQVTDSSFTASGDYNLTLLINTSVRFESDKNTTTETNLYNEWSVPNNMFNVGSSEVQGIINIQ